MNIGALLLFPGLLITLRGDVEWPARSPDLSPCDVFLWGYLKEKVFKHVLDLLRILRKGSNRKSTPFRLS